MAYYVHTIVNNFLPLQVAINPVGYNDPQILQERSDWNLQWRRLRGNSQPQHGG